MFCLLASIAFAGCFHGMFIGTEIGNDEQFALAFSALNTTKTHHMRLEARDTVKVIVDKIAGRVDITVADNDGNEIYRGNNAFSGEFVLTIPKTSTYVFRVTGRHAKGSVTFTARGVCHLSD